MCHNEVEFVDVVDDVLGLFLNKTLQGGVSTKGDAESAEKVLSTM
jgi:hypothetical protein